MRFYTASKLGSKRARTPEGYLVCLDVPIARTGEMIYAGAELPGLEPGRDGLIRVQRDADAVFDPASLASFVGKPTTNDHPPEMVGPTNYSRYAKGSAQNVRQGDGAQSDLILADLMFWDPTLIAAIEGGKDEISNGYDAEYEFVSPGVYRQVEITGNHVAVVDEGRCGARCAIGDSAAALQSTKAADAVLAPISAPSCGCGGGHHHHDAKPAKSRKRTRDMAATRTKLKGSMLDRLRRSFAAKDEAGFEEAMNAVEMTQEEQDQADLATMIGEAVASALAPIATRLDDVDSFVADRKTRDAEEEAAKAKAEEDAKAEAEKKAAADRKMKDRKAKDSAPSNMGTGGADGEDYASLGASSEQGGGSDATLPPGVGSNDSPDLAAFLTSKGMTEGDVAAALALVGKKDEPETETSDSDDGGAGAAWSTPGGSTGPADAPYVESNPSIGAADKRMRAKDSAAFLAEFRDTVAKAEILFPGVKLPSYDAKAAPKATNDAMCALRRNALKSAFDSAERKANVTPFLNTATPDFSKMTCDAVKLVFAGASELAKRGNSPGLRTADTALVTRDAATRTTIDDMNAAAKALWAPAR